MPRAARPPVLGVVLVGPDTGCKERYLFGPGWRGQGPPPLTAHVTQDGFWAVLVRGWATVSRSVVDTGKLASHAFVRIPHRQRYLAPGCLWPDTLAHATRAGR